MAETYYILDSNAIAAAPDILSRVRSRKLLIPQLVLEELLGERRRTGMHPRSLLEQAIARGLEIPKRAKVESADILEMTRAGLSGADIEIASLADEYAKKREKETVIVVTLDRQLRRWLSLRGIQSLAPQEFALLTKDDEADLEVQRTAKRYIRKEGVLYVGGLLSGLAVAGAYNYRSKLQGLIPTHVPVPVVYVLLLATGVLVYMWRQKERLSYGAFETSVGMVLTYDAASKIVFVYPPEMAKMLPIMAGLYVIVRGLDNLGKGLQGTRVEQYWTKCFGKA